MDVSIIIVNYNTKELTAGCIDSIIQHTSNLNYEIIVVDNDSKDLSVEFLESKYFLKVIKNSTNIGFGRANNIGSKIAHGKYLFFLNSDTVLLNNAIYLFYAYFENIKNCKLGALGGRIVNLQNEPSESFGHFISFKIALTLQFLRILSLVKTDKWLFNREKNVDYVIGADLFMLKSTFEQYGGFDPVYFMYYEESDLQKRMSKDGYIRRIIPEPIIMHYEGACFEYKKNVSNKKRILIESSMFIFLKRFNNLLLYSLFRFIYVFLRLPSLFDTRYTLKERLEYFKTILSYY
jgi:GT2 family glycosyltransferase